MYQKDDDGVPFPKALEKLNIIPGVKPHLKVYVPLVATCATYATRGSGQWPFFPKELPGKEGDTVMQGLDSLAQRCKEYKAEEHHRPLMFLVIVQWFLYI